MKPFLALLFMLTGVVVAADEQPLLDVLRSGAPLQAKSDACKELARVGTGQAVPVLAPLLEDEELADMARFALETIGDPAADEALRVAAGKAKGHRLIGIIHSLGVRGDPASAGVLGGLLKDPDPAVVRAAAHALGEFGAEALPPLGRALATVADEVRPAVVEGLLASAGKADPAKAAAVYDKLRGMSGLPPHLREAAFRGAVVVRGTDGLPLLAEAIRKEEPVSAAAAIGIALEISGEEATRMLAGEIAAAADPKRIFIVRALGRRGEAGAASALVPLARKGSVDLRVSAIQSLAQIGDPSSLPVLAELVGEADQSIAAEALAALAAFPGDGADPVLMQLLNDPKAGLKPDVIEAVGQRKVEKAVPVLSNLALSGDVGVAVASLKALRALARPEDLPGVIKALEKPATAAAAEAALVAISSREANSEPFSGKIAASLASAKGEARLALLRVLGKNGDPVALKAVRSVAEDQDAAVKQAAQQMLAEWPAEPGFVSIFNGQNLSGWNGKPGWWGVVDGAITSESTPAKPCAAANYLMWRGDTPADFELRLEFKISAQGNSGIQIRSAELPEWDTFGYQADMTGDGSLMGFIYHHQYGLVAERGKRMVFGADGKQSVESIGDAAELLKHYKPDDWNTYHIVCRGPQIQISINGRPMCEVTDHRVSPKAARGVIALQMHPGPPMKVQFRNLRIKRL